MDDLPEQLGPQDVLVVTSRYEAAPYLFLEAAAAGAWILTLDVGGVEELSRHYERMTVLPQGSTPADIAAALVEAQNSRPDPAETAGLSELLSIERMVEQTVRAHQEAIQMPDGPTVIFIGGWGRTGARFLLDSSPRHPEWRTSERSDTCGAEVYWGTPNAAAGARYRTVTSGLRSLSAQASRRQKATQGGWTAWWRARLYDVACGASRAQRIPIDRSSERKWQSCCRQSWTRAERRSLSIRARTSRSSGLTREISELCSSTSGGRQLPWSMPGPIHRGIARLLSGLMRSRTLAWGERWRTYTRSTSWHCARHLKLERLTVDYESLVEDPEPVVLGIGDSVGRLGAPSTLSSWKLPTDYGVQHSISGNPSRFDSRVKIRRDTRYRERMKPWHRWLVSLICAPLSLIVSITKRRDCADLRSQ